MNNTFINPYNFVPFGDKISEEGHKKTKQEAYRSDSSKLLSGWMDIDIYIKTPLIIPDGAHKDCSFLKLPGGDGSFKYAIPGSELRGVIRSAYECVTDSCVPFLLRDGNKLSQRVPIFGSLHRRGLLCFENGKWKLYSARTVGIDEVTIKKEMKTGPKGKPVPVFRLFRTNGKEVTEKTGDFSKANNGVVQYNIPVDTKKTYHIAYLQKDGLIREWSNDEPYQNMCSVLDRDAAHIIGSNPNQGPCNDLKAALEREHNGKNNNVGVPVYYFYVVPDEQHNTDGEKLVYLSNSAIGRIAQRRKWRDIIGEHTPCDGRGELCPACLLFGSKEGEGLKGHVRFTDAFSDDELTTKKHCLGTLAGPRPSSFEFYLKRPVEDATYWNFDFYGVKVQHGDRTLTEYRHLDKATPRGRKFYWHSDVQKDPVPGNQNSTMEAVENCVFHSKVYFDGISETQLNDLMWVISMGENSKDSTLQFKLGHAKPLGYGSCKLVIGKLHKRIVSGDEAGNIKLRVTNEIPDIKALSYGTDSETVKAFLKISDTRSTAGQNVEYPNGAFKTFEWFSGNRRNADAIRVLPDPLSDNLCLNNAAGKGGDVHKGGDSRKGADSRKTAAVPKDVKTIVVNRTVPDRKDPSMKVAYYEDGIVLGVPSSVKSGDSIKIDEFREGPKGKMAKYIGM